MKQNVLKVGTVLLLILNAAALSTGCQRPVNGVDWKADQIAYVREGETVPFDGVLMTPFRAQVLLEERELELLLEE